MQVPQKFHRREKCGEALARIPAWCPDWSLGEGPGKTLLLDEVPRVLLQGKSEKKNLSLFQKPNRGALFPDEPYGAYLGAFTE